ncbi:SusC/RagA family TonB-linked outer membrane protein [Dokdonia donghaensis]|uniref:TonB-dependent receptor n=1 Tax=Dokdonia donghaensis DSW-1 TaxID=1300343 RepID=A0A0A2GTH9_9FLAO|nr:TonB-dependent receptor [Dokdonia donghaensis]ANH60957.1 Vitamin B12 transporter BtuB [Dokdonia donghaensis DSW-1]KGO05798.1 hypothetical protein NV36_02360 [Dokdonia donghaensis DSW-1]
MKKTIIKKYLFLVLLGFMAQVTLAQKTITGTVKEQNGPLPGASVLIQGTTTGTQTDFDGNFSIEASSTDVLTFSYVGFKEVSIPVGNQTIINVTLEEDNALDEVVIVAFGSQTKKKNVQSVSVVGQDAIKDIPANSPQELLQGQAAGVQVVQSSGVLGAAPTIKIRGVASVSSGSRPLFVVDGVPLNDTDLTSNQGANQGLNPLANINPNDIESISVLKDASATAIYGSRGSNGVVIVTTKSGSKGGQTTVTLNVSTGISESTDTFDMMNADEFRQYAVDANYFGIDNVADLPQGGFNWVDGVTRTGISNNIDASVSGGSEKTSFYISTNFKDEEGFIIGNDLKRRAGRLNINHTATDWLEIGANIGITRNEFDRVGAENSTFAPLTSAYLIRPWVQPRDENGNLVNTGFIANTIAIESLDINDSDVTRTTGNVSAKVSLFEGLTFNSRFGIDRVLVEEQQRSFELNSPGGTGSNFYAQDNRYILTNTLNYDTTFGDKHDLGAVAGISYEENTIRTIAVAGTGFASDSSLNIESAAQKTTTTSSATANSLVGYFARVNYAYDSKYVLEGSLRRDGSSRFGADNRFGTFFALGGAWNLSEEKFLEDSSWINNLKLRASFGTTGNDRIGNFQSLALYSGGTFGQYNDQAGLAPVSAPNPDLKWERSKAFDIGLAGDLFNNRISFSVDYYKKRTDDLILNLPLPISTAAGTNNTIARNVGEIENRGFDVSLTSNNFRDGDFKWTTTLNIGFNTNEVISLPGASIDTEGREFIAGSASQRAIVGESINTFYLVRYKGVNPQTGDAEWLDADGNATTNPNPSTDRVIAGDANPDFVGGLTNTFKYKNFDLNVLTNFSVGNDIYVDGLRFTDNAASGSFNNRAALLNVWQQPGDNAFVPAFDSPTFNTFAQRSTAQLRDGSFLRFKNVTLGYTIPKSVLDKTRHVKNIRLYATATNLITIKGSDLEGIDPEVTDTSAALGQGETFFTPPQSKSFIFGATIQL